MLSSPQLRRSPKPRDACHFIPLKRAKSFFVPALDGGQSCRYLYFVVWRNDERLVKEFLHLTKALADENRVRLLLALRRGELCACQLTELLQLAPSTVSKHLFLLKHAGLVESRKDGRWIYFKLADNGAPVAVREAIDWVKKSLGRSPGTLADAKRLRTILKQDPSELCKRPCKN
jgi:DNA-binding transcriptional ArsR family regulator